MPPPVRLQAADEAEPDERRPGARPQRSTLNSQDKGDIYDACLTSDDGRQVSPDASPFVQVDVQEPAQPETTPRGSARARRPPAALFYLVLSS